MKVLAAFAAVLAVAVGLGLFAVQRLGAVNDAAAEVRNDWLPGTGYIGKLAAYTERFRITQAYLVLADNDEERREAQTRHHAALQLRNEVWNVFERTITPGDERAMADELVKAWTAYLEADQKLLALIAAGNTGEAANFFSKDMRPIFDKARSTVARGIDLNTAGGKEAADRGGAVYESARLWIFGALGLAALLCVGAGLLIVASVSKPIAAMTAAMQRLAGRDMSVEIVGVGRKDEIGGMAAAVQVFKDNMIKADALAAEQAAENEAKQRRAETLDGLTTTFEAKVGQLVGALSSAATEMESTATSRAGCRPRSIAVGRPTS
jgi:methyl-accepting chemotaxis protein